MSQELPEVSYKALVGGERPAWCKQGEAIYQITSAGIGAGRFVSISMRQSARDMDSDGIEETFHAETVGRMVDIETGQTLMIGSRAVQTDVAADSITFSQADEGLVDTGEWVIGCHDRCIFRTLRREQASLSIESLTSSGLLAAA